MAFDARTISRLYESLVPIMGEDDANRLVPQVSRLLEKQFVSRDELRAEVAALRSELRGELAELRVGRTELRRERPSLSR